MAALAAFANSDEGRIYALVCQRWGVDPGAALRDDFLAHNLRAALMVSRSPEVEEEIPDWRYLQERRG